VEGRARIVDQLNVLDPLVLLPWLPILRVRVEAVVTVPLLQTIGCSEVAISNFRPAADKNVLVVGPTGIRSEIKDLEIASFSERPPTGPQSRCQPRSGEGILSGTGFLLPT
jgi:hypothetical protein